MNERQEKLKYFIFGIHVYNFSSKKDLKLDL